MFRNKRVIAALLAAVMMISACGCAGDEASHVPSSAVTAEAESSTYTSSADVSVSETDDTQPAESSAADAQAQSTTSQTENQPEDTTASAPAVTTTSSTAAATSATVSVTTVSTPTEKPVEKESGLVVTYTISNTWQEDGGECSQLEFTIRNTDSTATESWQVSIDIGQNAEIMQSWNVQLSSGGSKLTASNVDYNGAIPAGGETSFGCIIKTPAPIKDIGGSSASSSSAPAPAVTTTAEKPAAPSKPQTVAANAAGLVSERGQLSVNGTDLVDESGEPVQLRGVSTHGIQWFPAFANKEAFIYLRDEWNINVIRLAMYSGAGEGYTDSTKAGIEKTVQNAVDYAIELDMYVIIDWHVLQDQSPQVRKADALRFFDYMSQRYADYPNVIYEICNEPNGYATWSGDVKPYAEEVIPVIRGNDPDSVIIVGTPTWSQDIDKALADPLKYDNIMYALHYYAATHTDWLRDRLKSCYNSGLPIMVTEFGNCDASGNGYNDFDSARKWLELLDSLNISYMNWSLCDKAEAASLLKPGASSTGGWSDSQLTENGKFMKDWFVNHK